MSMSVSDDGNSCRTTRLEAAFNNAKKSYDELKIKFFQVKEDLTLANDTLDKEYERWKKSRQDSIAATPLNGGAAAAAAVAAAQSRFDRAQLKYNDINADFIRFKTAFKRKDAEMDKAFQKWANSRRGRLRKSTPACWNRSRKACEIGRAHV